MLSVTSLPQTTTMRHRFKRSMDICASPCWSSALLSSKMGQIQIWDRLEYTPVHKSFCSISAPLLCCPLRSSSHTQTLDPYLISFARHPYGCPKFLSRKMDILLDIHFFFQCFSHSFRSQLEIGICHFNSHCLVSLLGSRKNRSTCSGKRI